MYAQSIDPNLEAGAEQELNSFFTATRKTSMISFEARNCEILVLLTKVKNTILYHHNNLLDVFF